MLTVIIPTFNERKNISKIINRILKLETSYDLEIIIVDDNSSDGTSDIVRKLVLYDKRIRLISRVGRSGLSSAIKEGCLCASGQLIAVMDADGQHEPTHIISALKCIKKSKVDRNVKISHLSYIGDSVINSDSNIGAGAITCNYDGIRKNKTIIGKNCFIGSNTSLVAPLKIKKGSVVGAGTVVNKDIPIETVVYRKSELIKKNKKK